MRKIKNIACYIFLTIVSIISIFPFVWMLFGATNKSIDIIKGKILPGNYLIENIKRLFEMVDLYQVLWTTGKIAVITTVLALIVSSLAGYGFEIFRTKWSDRLFGLLLLSMMIPFSALMIPLFRIFGGMNLLNNEFAVIIPSIATAFLIFFFRQNTKSFPKEILQAARVDGLGEFGAFFKIYIPTMKSTYAAAAIITFMSSWNSFMWPLIVLQTQDKKTLPIVISSLSSAYQPDYGVIMVAIVIATLPTAILFFIMQKSFVEGMVGSVK